MLQSSFNLIRQHFSPNSPLNKNVFLTKDYDYPNHFIQKLYLSYLQLQQTFLTSSTQEIVKRINIVSNKADSSFQNTILAIVYGIILNTGNTRFEGGKSNDFKEQVQNQKPFLVMEQRSDAIKFSQQILRQIKKILPLFRAEAWALFNNITLTLIMNHFHEIKQTYKFGLIAVFGYMQQFESCSDNLFILIMKTLNFYDQTTASIKYNLQLLQHFNNLLKQSHQISDQPESVKMDKRDILDMQRNNAINIKSKRDQQISLMRLYFFVKLVHIQYLANRMRAFMKGQWPFYLQKLCTQGLKMLKKLFSTNPDQCLVFSAQMSKYISYSVSDPQLQEIFERIRQYPVVKSQMLSHHYSLVPLSIQMMLPFQLQQCLNQLEFTMTQSGHGQQMIMEKSSILMSLGWIWRQISSKFSGEQNKSYLLENALPDLVRWAVTANGRNMEFKTIIIEWAMYQCPQNEIINKLLKQAFFQDLFYYIKNLLQINLQIIFPVLSVPCYILNFLSFYSPHLAEQLFLTIFNKLTIQISDRQVLNSSEQFLRSNLNQVLYKANVQGLLRINEIIYHSHLGNYIKNQLQLRIQQAQKNKKSQPTEKQRAESVFANKSLQKSRHDSNVLSSLKLETEYYGSKDLDIEFNTKGLQLGNPSQQQEDLIYTSHELIPSSPSYQQIKEPHLPNLSYLQNNHSIVSQNQGQSFKRENQIPTYQLERQLSIEQIQPQQKPVPQQNIFGLKSTQQKNLSKKQTNYEIHLQKEFYEEMGSEVDSLLAEPTIIQFSEYMKQLTKTLKDYKKSGQQQEVIQTFIQQTSKVLYLAFNHQFQSFELKDQDPQKPKESHYLTYFLLKSIHQHWKQSLLIYQVFIYKKIVRTLIDSFPSCQFAFYLTFLDIFKKTLPHFRQMNSWLIKKQREKYVIPVLQKILGNKFKIHIYQSAQFLKIQ